MLQIRFKTGSEEYLTLQAEAGENLLSILQEGGVKIAEPCGGMGRCKKCLVSVTKDGGSAETHLACQYSVSESCMVEWLREKEENLLILGAPLDERVSDGTVMGDAAFGIAVDIGTTTLATALVDISNSKTIQVVTAANSQRRFGADVITRIKAASEGKADSLRESIQGDVNSCIGRLLEGNCEDVSGVKCIAVAGNTAMLHLLMGYPVKSLGEYPFKAYSLQLEEHTYSEVFGVDNFDAPVFLLPGCSAFVGADIVSGMYDLGFPGTGDTYLLIDLGTNGEMAIGNRDRLLVASAAAGPAFEGGNIGQGMGSIPGAISTVEIDPDKKTVRTETIGGLPAAGLCGTGALEAVSELFKAGVIDGNGTLTDEYFDEGFLLDKGYDGREIRLTQGDIRELQMGKAAIRAGLELLMKHFGVEASSISNVFIAGGFGYYLDVKKAASIGLIPDELPGKTKAVGNSSLNGAIRFLKDQNNGISGTVALAQMAEEVTLAKDPDFNDIYMKYMTF